MRRAWASLVVVLSLFGGLASADETASGDAGVEDSVSRARRDYDRGNELARATRWAEALGAFESSLAARPHALTLYNLGVCERVLGRATRAREDFSMALARPSAEAELPASIREEIRGFLEEYSRLLPRVTVTLAPADAGIAVDGRPLRVRASNEPSLAGLTVLEAGVLPPGIGRAPSSARFVLELDPGTHVVTLTRRGFRDIVLTRELSPGERTSWNLTLAELPSLLHVSSSVPGAQVRVDDVDVGLTPVDVTRRAGAHRVVVAQKGYVPFTQEIVMGPGEESSVRARLVEERVSLVKKPLFWAGAAGVVATVVVVTFLATRPTPPPAPYDGGSSGWVVAP